MTKPAERFSLAGKVALVIGGSSGIGREIALGFRESGARVIPVGKTQAKVDDVVAALRTTDAGTVGHAADITDFAELRRLVDGVIRERGAIDILVNSQGTTILKPAEDFDPEDYARIMDVNLRSVFFASTEVGRHMLSRSRGSIITIASIASFMGFQKTALYTMSKWGVVGMTQALAAEWAGRGVRVNAIAPGFFMTVLNKDKMSAERKENALRRTPMGRFGSIEELVSAAIFLASDGSSYVTGETIRVDGGYCAAGL
ncbi:SDR family NAD(P)-dependent oxidoreductase [Rhodoligotrophos ferricapiens]|uniref:SDR family NAD(P)-dependent oxidoreductase n=1 Tax=Rhodoligotrophos ferricapiens TaxID=3069264 RepID=UPI00315C4F36